MKEQQKLEEHFSTFRKNTIGYNATYLSPYGEQKILYADWIASGRLYKPIEDKITNEIGLFVANTHTETSETGTLMTKAYHEAHNIIKQHVNAGENDVIITSGFGMTAVINKFQRILGLKGCKRYEFNKCGPHGNERPVVFLTHMEHHSNHTSWYETIADVVIIKPEKNLLVDLNNLEENLKKYKDRKFKIGSFTACSNVTGIITPYYEMAELMHRYGGVCFVDFAASAPYVKINMHPKNPMQKLDAVFFSPHKFLGGPGTSGVLVFDKSLYNNEAPDNPGGGTVDWTNPWGEYKYIDDIELREDGGTPGFLQSMRTALCIDLKNKMNPELMAKREEYLIPKLINGLKKINNINILADNSLHRIGAISFYHNDIHYNLFVKLLSDRFGIQVRGGCACAGTYGHFLLAVDREKSKKITEKINHGDNSEKPGWVRLSVHPTMTEKDTDFILNAVEDIVKNHSSWKKDYVYSRSKNEFYHKSFDNNSKTKIKNWLTIS